MLSELRRERPSNSTRPPRTTVQFRSSSPSNECDSAAISVGTAAQRPADSMRPGRPSCWCFGLASTSKSSKPLTPAFHMCCCHSPFAAPVPPSPGEDDAWLFSSLRLVTKRDSVKENHSCDWICCCPFQNEQTEVPHVRPRWGDQSRERPSGASSGSPSRPLGPEPGPSGPPPDSVSPHGLTRFCLVSPPITSQNHPGQLYHLPASRLF